MNSKSEVILQIEKKYVIEFYQWTEENAVIKS